MINTPELVRLGYNGFSKLYRPNSQKVLWNSYEETKEHPKLYRNGKDNSG